MKYQVTHKTTYRYSEPVILCQNQAHWRPRNMTKPFRRDQANPNRQVCENAQLTVSPTPTSRQNWVDFFGNEVTFFSIEESHVELVVAASSVVRVDEPEYPPLGSTPAWEVVRGLLSQGRNPEMLAASQFTFDSPQVTRSREAADYAQKSFDPDRPILDAVMDLTTRVFTDFKYDSQATCVHTSTAEVFRKRRGVCQDFAHLQITCLRSIGLAARYVSGYLLTDPPPGQAKLIGANASHAWLSVYCPPYGWFEFDPTNNQMPTMRHVTVAWGRDYSDVRPVQGVFIGGGQHSMMVSVDVSPV